MILLLLPLLLICAEAERCPLECLSGGVCKLGTWSSVVYNTNVTTSALNRFYCHCPSGYAGRLCEVKYEDCPGPENENEAGEKSKRLCPNGAYCTHDINHDRKLFWHCGCDEDITDFSSLYARRTCRHFWTVFCNDPSESDKNQQMSGMASGSYCEHGGRCKGFVSATSGHPGCICPSGWEGSHCEKTNDEKLIKKFHLNDTVTTPRASYRAQTRRRLTLMWMGATLVFLTVGSLVYNAVENYGEAQRRRRRRLASRSPHPPELVFSDTPTRKKKRRGRRLEPMEIELPKIPEHDNEGFM